MAIVSAVGFRPTYVGCHRPAVSDQSWTTATHAHARWLHDTRWCKETYRHIAYDLDPALRAGDKDGLSDVRGANLHPQTLRPEVGWMGRQAGGLVAAMRSRCRFARKHARNLTHERRVLTLAPLHPLPWQSVRCTCAKNPRRPKENRAMKTKNLSHLVVKI